MAEKYNASNRAVDEILNFIKSGEIAIPEIQRPFVWKPKQVRDLILSIFFLFTLFCPQLVIFVRTRMLNMITVFFISILFLQIYYFSFTFQVSLSLSCYTVRRLQLTWWRLHAGGGSTKVRAGDKLSNLHKTVCGHTPPLA